MRNWNPALVCSPQRDKIYKNEHKQTQKIVFFESEETFVQSGVWNEKAIEFMAFSTKKI